jgi:CheY-like chemotaxis protein
MVETDVSTSVSTFNNKECNVLVVDDNFSNQQLLYQFLSQEGFLVDMADNGLEAVTFIQKKVYAWY